MCFIGILTRKSMLNHQHKNDLQTFCLQATEGIKEAFEEKTKQSAAHYESSKVIYNSSFIIH